jgi:hypothetical protein
MADDAKTQASGVNGSAVAENSLNKAFSNSTLLHANFRMVGHGMLRNEVLAGFYGLHGGLRVNGVAITNAIFMPSDKKDIYDYFSCGYVSNRRAYVLQII